MDIARKLKLSQNAYKENKNYLKLHHWFNKFQNFT